MTTADTPLIYSLHDEVMARLRNMILSGELPDGSKVPEAELCERLQISRTPLREALKVLAAEGYVTLTPNRGATVAPLTLADIEDAFPVLSAIEALSGATAARLLQPAERDIIFRATERMRTEHEADRLESYFAANREVHYTLANATRNPVLIALYDNLFTRVRRARVNTNLSLERRAQSVTEHEEMLVHLEARDEARMAETMRRHIDGLLDYHRATLKTQVSYRKN